MLKLLLKTRLQYYRHYIKHNFDRITVVELGTIFLIFFYLLLRSPADIGYRLDWLLSPEFSALWAKAFLLSLPSFYLLAEFFAWLTLRPASEWHILSTLPFDRRAIASYFLIRHFSKISILVFIASVLFFGGTDHFYIRLARFLAALGILFLLQLISFSQAQLLRNPHQRYVKGFLRWLTTDVFMIVFLLVFSRIAHPILVEPLTSNHFAIALVWLLTILMYSVVIKNFLPYPPFSKTSKRYFSVGKTNYSKLINKFSGTIGALIFRDIILLRRQKRSAFWLFISGVIFLALVTIVMDEAFAAYIALLSLQLVWSFLIFNSVLFLFEQDVLGFELCRSLPLKAVSMWWARWFIIFGFLSSQLIFPAGIIALKFPIAVSYLFFLAAGLAGIPAIMATLYCNSGFGLFPHVRLSGYMTTISLLLIILFWFFMPFGSLFILAVIIFWIHRSQKRFQFLELT